MAAYKSRKLYVYFNPEIKIGGRWEKHIARIPKAQIILLVQKARNAKEVEHPKLPVNKDGRRKPK